ncbi:MAG: TrkA family potassium uptake protein [Acidobacteria bacterium]|nr:TrkA family potassium uptake protein [Acidobacteriota bacterium]
MKRFVVVGLGNFGSAVAETLSELGHEVAALDTSEEAVDRLADRIARAAVGSGLEASVLERIGARSADAAIISTGDDITASALTTLALKDLGIKEIYVKVVSRDHGRVMERLGATETVFPERDSAQRLARQIASRRVVKFVELAPGFSLQEMAVPDRWVGRSLRELDLPHSFRVVVVGIHDYVTGNFGVVLDPDAPLTTSDTLILVGGNKDLERLDKAG